MKTQTLQTGERKYSLGFSFPLLLKGVRVLRAAWGDTVFSLLSVLAGSRCPSWQRGWFLLCAYVHEVVVDIYIKKYWVRLCNLKGEKRCLVPCIGPSIWACQQFPFPGRFFLTLSTPVWSTAPTGIPAHSVVLELVSVLICWLSES